MNRYGSRSFSDEYAIAITAAVHKMIVMATRGVVSAPVGLSAPSCCPTRMLTAIERPSGTCECDTSKLIANDKMRSEHQRVYE